MLYPEAGETRRLGRLPSVDIRDLNYPIRAVRPVTTPHWDKPARYWTSDEVTPDGDYQLRLMLDQGFTGTCVGHAWTAWEQAMLDRPGNLDPFDVYRRAVAVDEWADNDHEVDACRRPTVRHVGPGRSESPTAA